MINFTNIGVTVRIPQGRLLQVTLKDDEWHMRILERVPNPVAASINKTVHRVVEGSVTAIGMGNAPELRSYLEKHQLADLDEVIVTSMAEKVQRVYSNGNNRKENQ